MFRTITMITLIILSACNETSETRNSLEVLVTECDDDNTIALNYDDVIIVSITHTTGSDMRQPVSGYSMLADNNEHYGLVQINGCGENVEVVYLYR